MHVFERFWNIWLKQPYRLNKTYDFGDGDTVLLLIHGIGVDAHTWRPLIDQIDNDGYRVIAYDLLGFGESPKPAGCDYSTKTHARAILYSLRKDLGRLGNKRFIIAGHSMGCIIASQINASKKIPLDQIILYQPPLLTPADEQTRRSFYTSFYKYLSTKPNLVISYSKLQERRAKKVATFTVSEESWIAFERSLRNTIIKQNALSELGKTTIPTDIIYGRLDFVVSRVQAKNLIAMNPNIVLHKIAEVHDISPRAGRFIKNIIKH